MRHCVLLLIMVAALEASCGPAINVAEERSALTALDQQWSQDSTDVNKLLSYYAPDATIYPQGLPMATGSEAIRNTITKMTSLPGFSIRWSPTKVDVSASGDLGYTSGLYRITMGSGTPTTEEGEYLTVWKRQSDKLWKAEENIFSADVAPARLGQQ